METIKCKECGKELSSKAAICPNCGINLKKNNTFHKIFKILEIIGILIVLGLIIGFGYIFIVNIIDESRRKSYIGVWELQTEYLYVTHTETFEYPDEEPYKKESTIIIDKKLALEDDNVYYGIGGGISCGDGNKILTERCKNATPVLLLNKNDKIVAINFNTTDGSHVYLCFKSIDKSTIKQTTCKDANSDEYNDGLYSMNGGVDEEFNIIYKKNN